MFNSSLVYGVPFAWKDKLDWAPIYKLTESGQYSDDPIKFIKELDDKTWKEDMASYQYCLDGRDLGDYLLMKHNPSQTFLIIDKQYSQYLSKDAFLKAREPTLKDYQRLIVFLNLHHIKSNFNEIGIYLLNDCTEGTLSNQSSFIDDSL